MIRGKATHRESVSGEVHKNKVKLLMDYDGLVQKKEKKKKERKDRMIRIAGGWQLLWCMKD